MWQREQFGSDIFLVSVAWNWSGRFQENSTFFGVSLKFAPMHKLTVFCHISTATVKPITINMSDILAYLFRNFVLRNQPSIYTYSLLQGRYMLNCLNKLLIDIRPYFQNSHLVHSLLDKCMHIPLLDLRISHHFAIFYIYLKFVIRIIIIYIWGS